MAEGARLFLSGVVRGPKLYRQRGGGVWYVRDLRARWVGPDDAEHVNRPDAAGADLVADALADADDVPAAVERLVVRGLVPADALDPGAPRRWDATTTLTGLSIAGCGCGRARVTLGGLVRVVEADLSDPSPGVAAALAEEVARSQNPPWGLTLAHVAVDATRRTLDAERRVPPPDSPWTDDRWFVRGEIARRTLDAERAARGSWPLPPTVAHLAAWARFGVQRIADAEALAREYDDVDVVRWRMVDDVSSVFLRRPDAAADAAAVAAARAWPDVLERLRALGFAQVEREPGRVTLTLVVDGV